MDDELPPQAEGHRPSIAHCNRCPAPECRLRWNAYNRGRLAAKRHEEAGRAAQLSQVARTVRELRRKVNLMNRGPERSAASAVLHEVEKVLAA